MSDIHLTDLALKRVKAIMISDRHSHLLFAIISVFLLTYYSLFAANNDDLRVISLSPHITEIIYKLDAGSHLIGRTEFCSYPPAVNKVESIGGYLNIDFEKIVRLEPDIIFQFPNPENRRKLKGLGFEVLEISNETIDEILEGIKKIGKALQSNSEALKLCNNIQDTLNIVSDRHQNQNVPLPAILVVGRDRGTLGNLFLAGSNTYLSELWELCGGLNAFNDIDMRYFSVNEEDLLRRDIKVILEFHPGWSSTETNISKEKKSWDLLNHLKAVEGGEIYIFTDRFFVIPGPRITQVAISFLEIVQNYNINQ
jgi:iron complex transport system substrate-binding protein